MLAALISGLKRQSGQWLEAFHLRDRNTSARARFFLFNLEFRHRKEKHPRRLPASTR
jgi:hypothetical protein